MALYRVLRPDVHRASAEMGLHHAEGILDSPAVPGDTDDVAHVDVGKIGGAAVEPAVLPLLPHLLLVDLGDPSRLVRDLSFPADIVRHGVVLRAVLGGPGRVDLLPEHLLCPPDLLRDDPLLVQEVLLREGDPEGLAELHLSVDSGPASLHAHGPRVGVVLVDHLVLHHLPLLVGELVLPSLGDLDAGRPVLLDADRPVIVEIPPVEVFSDEFPLLFLQLPEGL